MRAEQGKWWEEEGIILQSDPNVWEPTYYAKIFLQLLENIVRERLASFGQCRVLDFGCGSGILAIAAANAGADVVAIDLNPDALALTRRNAQLNQLDVKVHLGDGFRALPNRECFDLIVANTPSIPGRTTGNRSGADAWNENGNGRLLLDAVLQEGAGFLRPGGRLLTANNSEQDMGVTRQMLERQWAGYRILKRCAFYLDLDMFARFRTEWVQRGYATQFGDRYIHIVHFIEAWT